jgi:ATP-binding cassette subfamily B protein
MGAAGGIGRTYGLQDHFSKPGLDRPPRKLDRAILRRIGAYFGPYKWQWGLVFLCIGVSAVLSVLPPFCVGRIIDQGIPHKDGRLIALMAAAMVGLAILGGLIGVLQQTLTARAGQHIVFDLRNALFVHLQKMGLRFYTATRSGEIVSRVNNDVNAVQGAATGTVTSIVSNVFTLTATCVALFSRSWRLALLAIMVVPAFYLPSRIVGGIRRRLSMQTQQSQAMMMGFLNERLHVGGSLLANIFGQHAADARTFSDNSATVRDLHIRQTVVGRWLLMLLTVFSTMGPALIFWYGGLQAIRGELTTGLLVVFAALLTQLYRPMVQLATVYVDIQGSVAVFDRIFEYLDMTPDVQDKPTARALPTVRGHIVFEDVGFTYPPPVRLFTATPEGQGNGRGDGDAKADANVEPAEPAEPFSLKGVSLEIRPGQRVALVGPSGAGKTTITYLVPRFYDPDSGRITLDGHDLRDLDQHELRRHIGVVTQETFLFHATIRENLLYSRPGASEPQLMEACRAANIHDFIAALGDGYDTLVGERGFRLSGGEKQRLSIARALLKDPAILILDEATSSLDATSEYLIQMALEKLLQGRTSLIIAHRLSTIRNADKIVVLEGKQVVEQGTHAELMARHGLYRHLNEVQTKVERQWAAVNARPTMGVN